MVEKYSKTPRGSYVGEIQNQNTNERTTITDRKTQYTQHEKYTLEYRRKTANLRKPNLEIQDNAECGIPNVGTQMKSRNAKRKT